MFFIHHSPLDCVVTRGCYTFKPLLYLVALLADDTQTLYLKAAACKHLYVELERYYLTAPISYIVRCVCLRGDELALELTVLATIDCAYTPFNILTVFRELCFSE